MPIDRAATLRNAEKLLRQGKLELAIAEYLRVVEDQPRDWNTANVLGDLYVRAGQIDKACDQFTRIADGLNDEGFLPKAGALYKKILKLRPDHEHALIQAAEIASSQGLLADARTYLNGVLDRRKAKGDQRGAAQIRIRLGSLDPTDFEARIVAARARLEINDQVGALRDLKEVADELAEKGRQPEAIEALREAAQISPEDEEIRERLLQVYLAAGDLERARQCAATVIQLKGVAAAYEAAGKEAESLEVLRDAARLDPEDADLRTHLARAFVARGDFAVAAEYLTLESAGDDPKLLLTVAEIKLRSGRADEALPILTRLLAEDPARRDEIAMVAWSVAEQAPDAAFQALELAADAAVAERDYPSAAAAIQEFVTRVSNHIPALMRLVEICVDGGLEATMYSAQAQLADAYIAAGSAAEARVIAEDLVAREPWERSNVERFRRALVLEGVADPDALIAERLAGQSPFTSTDLSVDFAEGLPRPADDDGGPFPDLEPEPEPPAVVERQAAPPPPEEPAPMAAVPAAPPARRGGKAGGRRSARDESDHFELSSNAIDLASILGEFETSAPKAAPAPAPPRTPAAAPAPPARAAARAVDPAEVDLSVVLNDIKRSPAPAPASRPAPIEGGDLDGVFDQLRDEASRQSALEAAEAQFRRGLALRESGRLEEAIQALQAASKSPRLRFQAASLLGRLYRERGAIPQAIESFERAAQAPAPSPAESHQLLYQLAELLESVGEVARALAICLELQSDVGEYGNLSSRIDRLTRVQARG